MITNNRGKILFTITQTEDTSLLPHEEVKRKCTLRTEQMLVLTLRYWNYKDG